MRLEFSSVKTIDVFYQFKYPEEFAAVLHGDAYWYPNPINILGYYNKFYSMDYYREFDMNHPKCWFCGRYIKKGDWWKGNYTGPCKVCYEPIRPY